MSNIYDNWEKLVKAVLRREKDRQLALCESITTSSSADLSSRLSVDLPSAEVPKISGQKFDYADLLSQNIFVSRDVKAMEFEEIRKATRNFGAGNLVGEGSLGCVYKGWISELYAAVSHGNGIAVAVKVLNNTTNLVLQKWVEEIKNLSQLRHPNLLPPIGYSFDTEKRILVYGFMPRGSLDNHLFRTELQPLRCVTSWLRWVTRIKVAVGVARGLAFLHDLQIPVIYQILKSDDILLDGDFNAKLLGTGIRKDVSIHKTEGPLGIINEVGAAYGPYAAPEYIAKGHLSTKCDVYSFGVVLVELITGRRALDRNRAAGEHNLIDWAKPYLANRRRLLQIMDRRLEGEYTRKEAYKVGQIALQCVSSNPTSRPRMAEVVAALEKL